MKKGLHFVATSVGDHLSLADGDRVAPPGHLPVLLSEAVEALALKPGGRYIDGTFGGGGHTRALLSAQPAIGTVFAFDADTEAVERARLLATTDIGRDRLIPGHANFGDLDRVAAEHGIRAVNGVLLDLGLSSFQLDDGERGFAFRFDAPLDMRLDRTSGVTAADLVNQLDETDLMALIRRHGEDPHARRIARAIVAERAREPIRTTARLAEVVSDAVGGQRGKKIHPATRSFQALRIAVNHELEMLERALDASTSLLAPGGRLVVISFHSLEDRIVKRFIERTSATCVCPPEQPICTCARRPEFRRLGRIKPSGDEVQRNPRSRSAVMRVAERTDTPGESTNLEQPG